MVHQINIRLIRSLQSLSQDNKWGGIEKIYSYLPLQVNWKIQREILKESTFFSLILNKFSKMMSRLFKIYTNINCSLMCAACFKTSLPLSVLCSPLILSIKLFHDKESLFKLNNEQFTNFDYFRKIAALTFICNTIKFIFSINNFFQFTYTQAQAVGTFCEL